MNVTNLVVWMLALCLISGCAKKATPAGAAAAKGSQPASGQAASQGAEGAPAQTSAGQGAAVLPPGFPTDVPIYAGATIVAGSAADPRQLTASLKTTDSAENVLAFYEAQLKENGWQEIGVTANPGVGTAVDAVKKATPDAKTKRIVVVMVGTKDGATTIDIQAAEKREPD